MSCANYTPKAFENEGPLCQGETETNYESSWDLESGEVSRNEEITCRAPEPEPYGGQKVPSKEEIEEMKKEQDSR